MNEDVGRRIPKLRMRVHGVSNRLWNEELAAVPKEERTWGFSRYISLAAAMSVCIPAYMLAAGLVAVGMNCWQALGTIVLGSLIALVPIILNAHPGTKYGIPFAVYARASFGVLGSHVPTMLGALVGCGWYGIQCWIGGQALFFMARSVQPHIAGDAVWWCFAIVWIVTMAAAWSGADTLKSVRPVAAVAMVFIGVALFIWTTGAAGGTGIVFSGAAAAPPMEFRKIFIPSLTAVVGFWAAFALNAADFTRYAKSQEAQAVGLAVGVPVATAVYSLIAIEVTVATMTVGPGHRAIWNPVELIGSFHQPVIAFAGLVAVLLTTFASSASANTLGPLNAFSNLHPGLISPRMGALIAGLVGIAFMPWRIVADPARYIDGWLLGTSGLLGPIAGVMLADYFVLRKRSLDVDEIYVRGGLYDFDAGFNRKALAAFAVGASFALAGMFAPPLHWMYEGAWFVGFAVSVVLYLALMGAPDVRAMIPPTPLLLPVDGFEAEPTA